MKALAQFTNSRVLCVTAWGWMGILLLAACGGTDASGPQATMKLLVTQSATSVSAGSSLTVTAQLADGNDIPVPKAGVLVQWSNTGTGGSFSSPTSLTNAAGATSVTFTPSPNADVTHRVIAASAGVITGTSADIITTAGPPAKYLVKASDVAVPAGRIVTITAQVVDAYNNVLSEGGRIVTWSNTGAGSLLSSPTSVTAGNGAATVALTTSTVRTTYTVTATDDQGITGVSGGISTTFSVAYVVIHFGPYFDCTPFNDPSEFQSSDVTVPVGAVVEWVYANWLDASCKARITSSSVPPGGEPFDSGIIGPGQPFQFVPRVAGTWEYVDAINGGRGTLTARAP